MSTKQWMLRAGVALLCPIALGIAAGPAQAATGGLVRVVKDSTGTWIEYAAAAAQTNSLGITRSGNTVIFNERVAIKAGTGCAAVAGDATQVKCTSPTWSYLWVAVGAGNDNIINKTSIPLHGDGGTGDDTISSGTGNDIVTGGPGNDYLNGEAGNDNLNGRDGADRIYAWAGNDAITGEAGTDLLYAGDGDDKVSGGPGNDTIVGEDGNDIIDAGAGNDKVTGDGHIYDVTASWSDTLRGGAGFDTLYYPEIWELSSIDLNGSTAEHPSNNGDLVDGAFEGAEVGSQYGTFIGNAADNVMKGGDTVVMHGGAGNDTLTSYDGTLIGDGSKLYGEAGDDTLTILQGSGDATTKANLLDGGPNATAAGDKCVTPFPTRDTVTNCER
jgi:hypothetical protein